MDYLEYCRRVQCKLRLVVGNNAAIPHYMCTLARRVSEECDISDCPPALHHLRRFKGAMLMAIGRSHSAEQFLFPQHTAYDNVPYICERANKWRLDYMEKLIRELEAAE